MSFQVIFLKRIIYLRYIAKGGPVLTFNTYNKFMHEFATPSVSSYQAKQGDYEFYLTSKSDNTITLRGTNQVIQCV